MEQTPTAPPFHMHPATVPLWEATHNNRQLILALLGVVLYAGLMIVAFYLGVCWLQNALGDLTLSIHELQHDVQLVLKPKTD